MDTSTPQCRSCGYDHLELVLALGKTPLANSLLTADQLEQPEPTYPLDLAYCPRCTLVQILETVAPEQLFREYLYFSSFSDTMVQHAERLVTQMISSKRLDGESLAAEVASNDGYLLQFYQRAGIPVLGIEPATNVAQVAEERGIPTLCEFFGATLGQQFRDQGKRADVIHGHNVLAHVADLNGFVEGLHLFLKDDGVVVIEVPYVKDMLDRCEFDTIYHEHLCYFSLTALDHLFERHGLIIYAVERVPIHGGSLRLFAGQVTHVQRGASALALLEEEAAWGVNREECYRDFARRVFELKGSLRELLADLKHQGKRIAAYGAAAKGSTLLNYFGIGRETLDFVVDRSTYKQHHYMPGVHVPIYAPSKLLDEMPEYALLLTWNFADEIMAQQEEYRRRGGRFVVPIPEPRVI